MADTQTDPTMRPGERHTLIWVRSKEDSGRIIVHAPGCPGCERGGLR